MAVKIDYDKCCWKDGKCVSESCGCESNAACGDSKGCDGCVIRPLLSFKDSRTLVGFFREGTITNSRNHKSKLPRLLSQLGENLNLLPTFH